MATRTLTVKTGGGSSFSTGWHTKLISKAEYGDYNGTKYIDGPNGRWPEGHPNHPWEAEAIAAENK